MIEKLQHKFALSKQGAKDMVKACVAVSVSDLVLMFPAGILYTLIADLLNHTLQDHVLFYCITTLGVLALISVSQHYQYNATFLATYQESGIRRTMVAEHLRKLPLSFFGKKDLSDLTTNMMNDCAQIETASSHWIPELVGSIVSVLIVGISLFFMFDWRLAFASFWVIPVAFLIVLTSSGIQKKAVLKNEAIKLDLNDAIQEGLETMEDLRSCHAEKEYLIRVNKKIKNVEKQALVTELTMALYVSSAQMILKLGIGTTCVVGGILFSKGEIDLLTFFLFLMIVSRLYDPMQIALQNFAAILSLDVQCERLDEILSQTKQTGTDLLSNAGYDIEFDHVRFSYNDKTPVLKDVSFKAKQNQVTALIGPSGSGKTTISRLATRFWDVHTGTITVGGMDISKVDPEHLMSLYSIVFQDVTLFNNTVMENIRIGRKGASDEEVLQAAKLANCDEFVQKLSNGYQTMIGENGKELSGGERQRISIARALLKDAPIILLDEATASLDVENETAIQMALSTLIQNKTVIIIAHRMRTIANADHIIVLKDGVVKEEGNPQELLKKNGLYKHMVELQTKGMAWKMK